MGIAELSPGMYEIEEVPKACPCCASSASTVYKTRKYQHGRECRTIRYRECRKCHHKYTTVTDKM